MNQGELSLDDDLRRRVVTNVAALERRTSTTALRPAAVGIVLVSDDAGRACFVLTRRPATMRRHANQYAIPGGRLDEGESHVEAALREVMEEIGVQKGEEDVLGLLDDYDTRSGFCITPVVIWGGQGIDIVPAPREVAAAHRVPLAELLRPDIVHLDSIPESDRPVLSLRLLNNRIFAPTAAILLQLREVALLGRDTRVSHYEQPRFAWR